MSTKKATLAEVAQSLLDLSGRLNGWKAFAPRLHGFLLSVERRRFETQGSSEGEPFAPQQRKWAKLKQSLGIDPVPLRWLPGKERLVPSLTKAGHPEHLWRKTFDGIQFGTRVPYAWRHAEGVGKNPLGEQIPQRRFAWLSERTQERLAQLLAIFLARGESRGNRWDT